MRGDIQRNNSRRVEFISQNEFIIPRIAEFTSAYKRLEKRRETVEAISGRGVKRSAVDSWGEGIASRSSYVNVRETTNLASVALLLE